MSTRFNLPLAPQPFVVHVDHLKKYEGPLPVKNWLINNDGDRQPPHTPIGPQPEVAQVEAGPGGVIKFRGRC